LICKKVTAKSQAGFDVFFFVTSTKKEK